MQQEDNFLAKKVVLGRNKWKTFLSSYEFVISSHVFMLQFWRFGHRLLYGILPRLSNKTNNLGKISPRHWYLGKMFAILDPGNDCSVILPKRCALPTRDSR